MKTQKDREINKIVWFEVKFIMNRLRTVIPITNWGSLV